MAELGEDGSGVVAAGGKSALRWTPVMSAFMLRRLVEIVGQGVKTNKGFKEIHLNAVAKSLTEYTGGEVTRTQVHNHLRKWRARWVRISQLRDLSGALWDDNNKMIVLEEQHYLGHTKDHPKDVEYLNVPLDNYVQMETIFSARQATGKYAMGSNEPLGEHIDVESSCRDGSNEGFGGFDGATMFDFGAERGQPASPLVKDSSTTSCSAKRKRSSLINEEETILLTNMADAVREMAAAVKSTVHTEAHPDVYKAVMDLEVFPEDTRLAVLDHLMEKKATSLSFVQMREDVRVKWVQRLLRKNPDLM